MSDPEVQVIGLSATQRVQLFIGQLVIQNAALQEEVDRYREETSRRADKTRRVRVVPPDDPGS